MKYTGQLYTQDGTEVPLDEVFILRYKDNAAPVTLEAYYYACHDLGASHEHLEHIRALRAQAANWRDQHPEECKTPD